MFEIGYTFKSTIGIEFTVVGRVPRDTSTGAKPRNMYVVRSEYGTECTVDLGQIQSRRVKDRWAPTIYGVGCIGATTYKGNEREYTLWHNMLSRCYNQASPYYKWYGAKGVSVCESWLTFSNFVNELPCVTGYEQYSKGEKVQLDKDASGSRVYSASTCAFISQSENRSLEVIAHRAPCKTYDVVSPEGVTSVITNLGEFARNLGIPPSTAYSVADGKIRSTRGWKFKRRN